MQVVAAVAMEPPAGTDPRTLKDSIAAVLRATRAADPAHYVRGQHEGYRAIAGVAPDSQTETYAALRLDIDNWRWAGVPFYIRTGKCLPTTQTEARLVFRRPPRLGFLPEGVRRPEPDQIVVKLDPSTGIRMVVDAKRGDAPQPERITMDMEFADEGGEGATPYEVLLDAAMRGDAMRFTRQDGVEEQWRIMQPLLDAPPPVHPYAKGTWGPEAGDQAARTGTAAGTARGWRHDHRRRSPAVPRPSRRARPRRRRSRRSRPTASSRTATPRRWSRPTARSAGCACRPSTRRACSGRCWTARPAYFRVGPFGIDVPAARAYEPGTNTLVTTWHTPSGWVVVRDALTMGPRRGEDTVTPHTRPPADDDGDHLLVRTIECIEGSVEMELVCEPVFDYGRTAAEWTLVDDDRHTADASGAGSDAAPAAPTWRSGSRAAARAPATRCARASGRTARCRGRQSSSRRQTSRRRRRGWPRPRASGARGWTGRGSRITAFREPIARSIARRSRA